MYTKLTLSGTCLTPLSPMSSVLPSGQPSTWGPHLCNTRTSLQSASAVWQPGPAQPSPLCPGHRLEVESGERDHFHQCDLPPRSHLSGEYTSGQWTPGHGAAGAMWALLFCAALVSAEVEVELEGLGRIRGKSGEARNKQQYFQFLGVPFAEPPTGDLR